MKKINTQNLTPRTQQDLYELTEDEIKVVEGKE